MFEYEHTSRFNVSAETRAQLIKEIEGDEFHLSPLQGKIMLNDVEEIIDNNHGRSLKEIEDQFIKFNGSISQVNIHEMFKDLSAFISTDPKLPDDNKNYIISSVPQISVNDGREKIIHSIINHTGVSELSLLTLYVYRQMDKIDWLPFVKAAIERNPVCLNDLNKKSIKEVYEILLQLPDKSIYDLKRLALPDEVWNFGRGDGIEKALLMADVIIQKENTATVSINIEEKNVTLDFNGRKYRFYSVKGFRKHIYISDNKYIIK
jgi:hypothetical protein